MSLNQGQNSEVVRGVTLEAFLADSKNNLIYKGYDPFNKTRLRFGLNVGKLCDAAKDKDKTEAGTVTKNELKRRIAKELGLLLRLTKDYAVSKKDTTLRILVDYSQTTINHMKDADVQPFVAGLAKSVYIPALFTDVDFIKYEVTSADFAAIVADATSFNNMIGDTNKDDNESSTANDVIDQIIDDIHIDITSFDNTIGHFNDLYPAFVNGYYKNKATQILGLRHEGIKGIVTKGGIAQSGAVVGVAGTDKNTSTDGTGGYELYFRPGSYDIEVTLKSGEKKMKQITSEYRTLLEVDFEF